MFIPKIPPVKLRQSWLLFCTASVVTIADQITKFFVLANMDLHQSIPEEGWFRLTYSTNSGSVFGLGINSTFLLVMAPIVIMAILWLYFFFLPFTNKLMRAGLGLLLGGAIGNFIDRARAGEVTDFIDVQLWSGYHWATFNIADASITTGIFIMIYCFMKGAPHFKSFPASFDIEAANQNVIEYKAASPLTGDAEDCE